MSLCDFKSSFSFRAFPHYQQSGVAMTFDPQKQSRVSPRGDSEPRPWSCLCCVRAAVRSPQEVPGVTILQGKGLIAGREPWLYGSHMEVSAEVMTEIAQFVYRFPYQGHYKPALYVILDCHRKNSHLKQFQPNVLENCLTDCQKHFHITEMPLTPPPPPPHLPAANPRLMGSAPLWPPFILWT